MHFLFLCRVHLFCFISIRIFSLHFYFITVVVFYFLYYYYSYFVLIGLIFIKQLLTTKYLLPKSPDERRKQCVHYSNANNFYKVSELLSISLAFCVCRTVHHPSKYLKTPFSRVHIFNLC